MEWHAVMGSLRRMMERDSFWRAIRLSRVFEELSAMAFTLFVRAESRTIEF